MLVIYLIRNIRNLESRTCLNYNPKTNINHIIFNSAVVDEAFRGERNEAMKLFKVVLHRKFEQRMNLHSKRSNKAHYHVSTELKSE